MTLGFITLLYAGTTSIFSFKYSFLNYIVIKLKQWSLSAGNIFLIYIYYFKNGTLETLCNETVIKTIAYVENIKSISIHVPTHFKPVNDEQFGHYLAGLIDGDGHFSKSPQLVITFNALDASLAYFIKSRLGYGNIYKVINKKAIILVVSKHAGIIKVLELINGKIRSQQKLDQIKNNILSNPYFNNFNNFIINNNLDLNNNWLAGFSDANSTFQIKLITRNERTEVRLNFKIASSLPSGSIFCSGAAAANASLKPLRVMESSHPSQVLHALDMQKNNDLLILIKNFLGGHISYVNKENYYVYNSISLGSARKIIKYFDSYHLQSHKHISFLKWRKCYQRIQEGRITISDIKSKY